STLQPVFLTVFFQVALLLRFVRPMKNQLTADTAQPALQRDPDECRSDAKTPTALHAQSLRRHEWWESARSRGRFRVGAEFAAGARTAGWRFHAEETLGVVQLHALTIEPIDVALFIVSGRIRASGAGDLHAARVVPKM